MVAGNPKPASRTLDAGTRLAAELAGQPPDTVLDVITLGPGLLGRGDERVSDAVRSLAAADLVVVLRDSGYATDGTIGAYVARWGPVLRASADRPARG
ncbi:hypothetical protein GCM10022233_75910 [Streptomyces shaanxiensis]|uniref:Uncharacterized protein n=1 Tax=Streptomyces shaanxiensis TaxID=653357 RepID=A0ABP7W839_9ACTN